MTPTPTALILDFGGVLTSDLWNSVRACSRREGLPPDRLLDLIHKDPQIHPLFVGLERGEVGQHEFETHLGAAAGIRPERLLERMCADLRPDNAMLAAVATLRTQGIRIGVLSNSWGSGYFSPYRGYRLEDQTDVVILSDQVRLRKPEPAIFELMLARLETTAAMSVFVDDVAVNLPPAEAMGMGVVHHVDTRQTLIELGRAFATELTAAGAAG